MKKKTVNCNVDAKIAQQLDALDEDCDLSNYIVSTYYIFNRPDWDDLAKRANSVRNKAIYLMRQDFLHHRKPMSYSKLNSVFKHAYKCKENDLYHCMGQVQAVQQLLRLVRQSFTGFYNSLSEYHKNPKKYTGKPKLPRCHKRGTRSTFFATNQMASVDNNGHLIYKKYHLDIKVDEHLRNFKLIRVSFVPITNGFKVLVTFEVANYHYQKDNGNYVAIDPGVDNAFACITNTNHQPLLINGKPIKASNHYYHKKKALFQKQQAAYQQKKVTFTNRKGKEVSYFQPTKAMERLDFKHNRRVDQFVYNALNRIVDYAINCNAKVVFIGKNKGWKNKVKLGKRNNQNFLGIPHAIVIDKLKAKLAYYGIRLITTEESYTSQTSFLDGEKPCKANGNNARKKKGLTPYKRRIERGLFKSDQGILINSDVNGALQIAKKGFAKWQSIAKQKHIYAFPKLSFGDGIKGLVLIPYKVNCSNV